MGYGRVEKIARIMIMKCEKWSTESPGGYRRSPGIIFFVNFFAFTFKKDLVSLVTLLNSSKKMCMAKQGITGWW